MSTKQSRSKTGCLTCKTRRKKCDEQRPTCERCARAKMECLGYSYLDNPEELAQARAKIAASRVARTSEQPNSPLVPLLDRASSLHGGHPIPTRSESVPTPSGMAASGLPSHDFVVRDTARSEGDATHLDVMEFPFLSQSSGPNTLDGQSHGQTSGWWGAAGPGTGIDNSGVGQSFTGQTSTSASSGHQSVSVEFHQPRHSEDNQLFIASVSVIPITQSRASISLGGVDLRQLDIPTRTPYTTTTQTLVTILTTIT
ncbi:maltose acetyltransferase [Rhizoctonia solani]|uniref:Maltose acetyltransferase n=1 Tax=Rhizoctonia solani TaxID=456999 RepID=A0A8H7IMU9_9AGAM|nr:maltose acetyltransferase [Rhizoctonia solani]